MNIFVEVQEDENEDEEEEDFHYVDEDELEEEIEDQDYNFFLSTSEYSDTMALESLMDNEGISVENERVKCCCFSSKPFTFCYK